MALEIAVVAVVVFLRGRALIRADPTDFDDAYMYLRYANNALAGEWLVWNRGQPPAYGVTSLLHLALVTAIRGVLPGLGAAAVLQLASGGAALLLLAGLATVCARFGTRARQDRCRAFLFWAALLSVGLGFREAFFFHAHSGMDTMLAALANTGVVYAALWVAEQPSPARALVMAAVGMVAVEARADNVIIASLCPLLALTGSPQAPRARALAIWAGAFAGLVLVDVALKWRLLGTPLPLSFYAKQPGYYRGFAGEFTWDPYLFLEVALGSVSPFLVATVLFSGKRTFPLLITLLGPLAATMAALFSVNQIMGHLGRFYFPSLPLLVLAGALSAERWFEELPGAPASSGDLDFGWTRLGRAMVGRPAWLVRVSCALVALLGGARALEAAGTRYERRAQNQVLSPADGPCVPEAVALPELDSWRASQEISELAAQSPPGTTFALSEHGLVGARAPAAVLIDVLGLHDRVFAREGFTATELWRRLPDAIWMPHPDHTQMLHDIVDSDQLWHHYVFYPDAFTYGLALRHDGPRYGALASLLQERWRATYPGFRLEDYVARRPTPDGDCP